MSSQEDTSPSIYEARNTGPTCGRELECERFPERIHAMAGYALIGAELDLDISSLPEALRVQARSVTHHLRREHRREMA